MPEELKTKTSVGIETPSQTVQRAKKLVGSISASDLANPVSPAPLTPPVEPSPLPSNGMVKAVADETNNIIAAQTEEAKQLKDLRGQFAALGEQGSLSDLYSSLSSEYELPQNMKELKDINLQLTDMQTDSDLTKSRIAGAAGQTLGQGGREITQEDREHAIRSAGLAARAAVLQGNIETASSLVSQAVNIAYQDRTLKNQNLLAQIQDLSGVVDDQTQQLLDKEQRKYEEDQAKIAEIKQAVNAAALSGAASAQEMQQLSDPLLSDEDRLALAQGIVARGAREDRALDRANTQSLIDERLTGGSTVTSSSGETLQVPTFEEWAAENGGRVWELGGSEAEMAALRADYESDIEVMNRANALSTLSPLAAEVLKNPKGYFDLTPTKRGEILEELSKAGIDTGQIQEGKRRPLSATQSDDLVQAQLARRNVVELYNLLQDVPGTGPIAGRIKALDPYSEEVAAIKAQINRTVPGLARGIFKEVGVLTDTDINRYSETLANMQFTDEQIEQLHNDTLSLIDDSVRLTTETYSSLGYDLGTFEFNPEGSGSPDDGLTDDEAYEEYLKQQEQ